MADNSESLFAIEGDRVREACAARIEPPRQYIDSNLSK